MKNLIKFLLIVTGTAVSDGSVEAWVVRYSISSEDHHSNMPRDMAIDEAGNVYVTGSAVYDSTGTDYTTIKYSSDGVEQWVQRYNGTDNGRDEALAVVVDNAGYVYVTGYTTSGRTDSDYATVKYSSDGVEQWVQCYNGLGNGEDKPSGIAVDESGNIYVTGVANYDSTGADYTTIKYSSDGVEQWVQRYNSPENGRDAASYIVVDNAGYFYVTGYIMSSVTGSDYATIKYNSDGVEQWIQRYNGLGNGEDRPSGIAVDGSGNVFVTGYSSDESFMDAQYMEISDYESLYDYTTIKYSSDGLEQWINRYNGPGNDIDIAGAIAVDGDGNAYVTGGSCSADMSYNYTTIKYNSHGVVEWVTSYECRSEEWSGAWNIALDTSGNVYVTGNSYAFDTCDDYATVKYSPTGVQQWVQRYNGPCGRTDRAVAISVDRNGNVYVTGFSSGTDISFPNFDYATVKYVQDNGF